MIGVVVENVISNQADQWLDVVRAAIVHNEIAGQREALEPLLDRLIAQKTQRCKLDLIGHATNLDPKLTKTPHGTCSFLRLDEWVIDDSDETYDFFLALAAKLHRARVDELRLLGCSTAMTPRGRRALARIAKAVQPIEVYGTNRVIYADDFNAEGFIEQIAVLVKVDPDGDAAVPSPYAAGTLPVPRADLALDRARLVVESYAAARDPQPPWPLERLKSPAAKAVWALIEPGAGFSLPLLLAHPVIELLLPTSDDDVDIVGAHRVQVLMNWELLRVFVRSETGPAERIYRVRDPGALHQLLGY